MDEVASQGVPRSGDGTSPRNMIVPTGTMKIWVPHKRDVWSLARVVRETADGVVAVPLTGGVEEEYASDDVYTFDPSHLLDLDDISKFNNLHEAPLLDCLRRRFLNDVIYTNVGDVLISINPYKRIPLLYDMDMHLLLGRYARGEDEEHDADLAKVVPGQAPVGRKVERPHVYTVADKAFRNLTLNRDDRGRHVNQSIIISGESGAGKTEASKYVMRYLISVSQIVTGAVELPTENKGEDDEKEEEERDSTADAPGIGGVKDEGAQLIETMLLESNVILEAFGNAKTMRNDNSSRFGKYIRLLYNEDYRLVGAETEHFLLERSRLVQVVAGERNYHVFYQLCQGLEDAERPALKVGFSETFRLCNMGETLYVSERVDDGGEWQSTLRAMSHLGISEAEVSEIKTFLAALLHLGNLDFTETTLLADGRTEPCQIIEGEVGVAGVAEMLGTKATHFQKAILARMITSGRGSVAVKHLTRDECIANIYGCVKYLYTQLFSWLVRKINYEHGTLAADEVPVSFIGILDIFGFEIMRHNSFEQLCINFANEALQQQFNQHVFVLEQEHYARENLDTAVVTFRDNQPIIDLIAGKEGLMPTLENLAKLNQMASETNFVRGLHKTHANHPNYARPKSDDLMFTISHFAGDVLYEATGFLMKNNDSLQGDLVELFGVHSSVFVGNILNNRSADLQTEGEPGFIPRIDAGAAGSGSDEDLPLPPSRGKGKGRRRPPSSSAARRRMVTSATARLGRGPSNSRQSSLAGNVTVSKVFRQQVKSLCETLTATEPHYIKCIKPNNIKAPGAMGPRLVTTQLRYAGVLEVVRIRREGYPSRLPFFDFYERYEMLIPRQEREQMKSARDCRRDGDADAAREACLKIASLVLDVSDENKEFQVGNTQLFLRDNGLDKMDGAVREFFSAHASKINAVARRFIARTRFRRKRAKVVEAQAFMRMAMARRRFKRESAAARLIQEKVKSRQQAQRFEDQKRKIVVMQALFRRGLAQRKFSRKARQQRGAVALQALVRGKRDRRLAEEKRRTYGEAQVVISRCLRRRRAERQFQTSVKNIVNLQTAVRGFLARKHFATALTVDRLRRKREAKMATRIQSVARMVTVRRAFVQQRNAATKLGAAYRSYTARRSFTAYVKAITTLQAHLRRRIASRSYAEALQAAIKIQATVRCFLAMRERHLQIAAVIRIEIAGRAFLRNLMLRRITARLFEAAQLGQGGELDVLLGEFPHLVRLRQRGRAMRTLLHAAAQSGDEGTCDVVFQGLGDEPEAGVVMYKTLPPRAESSLHVAASTGRLPVVQHLLTFVEAEHEGEALTGIEEEVTTADDFLDETSFKRRTMHRANAYASGLRQRRRSSTEARSRAQQLTGVSSSLMSSTMTLSGSGARSSGSRASIKPTRRNSRFANMFGSGHTIAEEGVDLEAVPQPGGETILRQGWLRKRRETDRWQKRWCVLTNTELRYYHRVADKKPTKVINLTGGIVKKSESKAFVFEIHSPLLLDRRNREGRLYFQAASEIELQAWLAPLRLVLSGSGSIQERDIFLVDMMLRKKILSVPDGDGRTLLHRAAATTKPEGEAVDVFNSRVVQLCCWLVENGVDPNARDDEGKTALHAAVGVGSVDVAAALLFKGTDQNITDGAGAKPLDGQTEAALQKIMLRAIRQVRREPLKPPPVLIPNLTFVSIYFASHMMAHTSDLREPFLAITVRNARGDLVEEAQGMCGTALEREEYVHWGQAWHMQTALENLDDKGKGTVMVVELKMATDPASPRHRDAIYQNDGEEVTLAWASLELDGTRLNTNSGVMLEMFEGAYEQARGVKRSQVEADRFLQVDTVVQKVSERAFRMSNQ